MNHSLGIFEITNHLDFIIYYNNVTKKDKFKIVDFSIKKIEEGKGEKLVSNKNISFSYSVSFIQKNDTHYNNRFNSML